MLGVGRSLRVFSLSSGRQLGTVSRATGGVISSVDVCDDAGVVVCGSRDCTLRWFDLDSFACQRVSAKRSQHTDSVTTVRFIPGTSGKRVVSSGLDGRVKLWDTETGQSVSASSDSSTAAATVGLLLSLDFIHPSAGSYVTGATCAGEGNVGEGRVALWDVRTEGGVVSQLTASCGLIPSISFCSYNNGIAAGGSDGVVRVYDMRRFTAETLHEVSVPATPVSAFAFTLPVHGLTSSLVADDPLPSDFVSLIPPSTSPPSPSILTSSVSSLPPSRRHIASVCLLPDRLIALQSTALTIFAASTAPPRKKTTFPFAHPIHSITLAHVTQQQQQQHSHMQPTYSTPADTTLVAMQTAEAGDILALSTTDRLTLWGTHATQQQHTHTLQCDMQEEEAAAAGRRNSWSGSADFNGRGRQRLNETQERRQSVGRAAADSNGDSSGQQYRASGQSTHDVARREKSSRRRSHGSVHRGQGRDGNAARR